MSQAAMRANQLCLWFASMAYVLLCALPRMASHTEFANASCGTLRLALLKISAQVRGSVHRIKVAMASAHPFRNEFALAHASLAAAGDAGRSSELESQHHAHRRSPAHPLSGPGGKSGQDVRTFERAVSSDVT